MTQMTPPPPPPPGNGKGKFKPAPVICTCNTQCLLHYRSRSSEDAESLEDTTATATDTAVDTLSDALSYVHVQEDTVNSNTAGPTPTPTPAAAPAAPAAPAATPTAPANEPAVTLFTIDDVLQAREIRETETINFSDALMAKSAFYVVIHGRLTGVFEEWATANACVTGFSNNCHTRRDTVFAAWAEWRSACIAGLVKNQLHDLSLFDKVVSDLELQARVFEANAELPDVQHAAAPTAEPAAGPTNTPPQANNGGTGAPLTPEAFVVIRGRQPGVFYNEHDWRNARATGYGGWAFPCLTAESAEAAFLRFEMYVQVIE